MGQIHHQIRIDAPIEHVFELACRADNRRQWNPYMEWWHLSGPVNSVGTTFDSMLDLMGQATPSKAEVVEVAPQRLIHIHEVAHRGTTDWCYRFVPDRDGTTFAIDVEYEIPGVINGVIDRLLFHGALDRATRHMVDNFAAMAARKVPQPA